MGKSSQQKQTTQDFFILAVKLDSVLICLCVCDKKFNFLSWAIKLVFAEPVTYTKVNQYPLQLGGVPSSGVLS